MNVPSIGCLVSGHGEVEAFPVLVRRLLHERIGRFDVSVGHPCRKPEKTLLKVGDDTLERTVARLAADHDAVLVLIDDEDGCPAKDGPDLLLRASAACSHKPVAVVLAYREYETWFLRDAPALLGVAAPGNPEAMRDAKGWLRRNGLPTYNPVADCAGLTGRLNLDVAGLSDSFRILGDRIFAIVAALPRPA